MSSSDGLRTDERPENISSVVVVSFGFVVKYAHFRSEIIAWLECVIASHEEAVAAEGRKVAIHFVGVLHVRMIVPH